MFLFDKNKLKVRCEEEGDRVRTFIEYYKIKQKDVFNVKVLRELIGDNSCLAVIDSRLLYSVPQKESKITFKEIIDHLDLTGVTYKKIEIKKVPEISMFGLTVKKGSTKTDKDYIVGIVINKGNIEIMEKYVNQFNTYYFIDKTGLNEETLLQKLEKNYEDIEEMGADFYCEIFNNNFMDQLVVLSGAELVEEIKEIVYKCYSQLQ